jgi:hypothetical protein
MPGEPFCTLQRVVGRQERCPGHPCLFWDSGGCALDAVRPDIETTPGLAAYLLDARATTAGGHGWRLFRLTPGGR